MIINKRNVLIFGTSYNYTISRLKIFKNEFNEYIDKFNENKIFLKNGITIQAITINDKKFYSNNYTQINANYFLEVCYRIAYYNNKKEIEEINMLVKQCELSVSNVMDCYCERTDCSGRIKDSKQYDSLVQKVETQQQELINYLEDETKEVEKTIEMLSDTNSCRIQNLKYKGNTLKEILQKYKEIIGEK